MFIYSNGSLEVYRRFQGDFFALGGFEGVVTREDLSMEEFVMGEDNFNEGGAGFSRIIKKNNEKINMKKLFQLKVRSSIKLDTNRKYYIYIYIRGLVSSTIPCSLH